MSVIVNTTVISNFASIGQLDLLRRLYGALAMTVEVYNEIQDGLGEGYRFYEGIEQWVSPFTAAGWIHLITMSDEQELRCFHELPLRLHRGEASSLAIAFCRRWLFLIDDQAARLAAARLGVLVSGSIGCLVLAVDRALCTLPQANLWLQDMVRLGYRSPVTDLASLMQEQ